MVTLHLIHVYEWRNLFKWKVLIGIPIGFLNLLHYALYFIPSLRKEESRTQILKGIHIGQSIILGSLIYWKGIGSILGWFYPFNSVFICVFSDIIDTIIRGDQNQRKVWSSHQVLSCYLFRTLSRFFKKYFPDAARDEKNYLNTGRCFGFLFFLPSWLSITIVIHYQLWYPY